MPSSLRILRRPRSLLAAGGALLLGALLVGGTVQFVQRIGEWGTPLREVALAALGLVAVGGLWLLWLEGGSYLRLRRVGKLRRALQREGRAAPGLLEGVQRWLDDLERVHGEPLAAALGEPRPAPGLGGAAGGGIRCGAGSAPSSASGLVSVAPAVAAAEAPRKWRLEIMGLSEVQCAATSPRFRRA